MEGYNASYGFIHYIEHTNAVCRRLCSQAGSVIVLMDSTKLDNIRPAYRIDARDVNTVVCDRELPADIQAALEAADVTIL